MINIAILASGNGSNAQVICEHFASDDRIRIGLIASNNPDAFVLQRARSLEIPTWLFNRHSFYSTKDILEILKAYKINFIVLAGFMWLIPRYLVAAYVNKIVNIHPALLPRYGGKGMYGDRVHRAIKAAGETETGITIHYVNENYDEGDIIFQKKCLISPEDTPKTIAAKVHELEYENYPKVIRSVIEQLPEE